MKNHEFVRIASQIAKRSNEWVHGELTRGPEHIQKDMRIEDRRRFCDGIREMLSWIEEEPPVPAGFDWGLSEKTKEQLAEIDRLIVRCL